MFKITENMNIILFRFEKEKIHFLACHVDDDSLVIDIKEKISLESANSSGHRYQKILDELQLITTKCSYEFFAYQPAPRNLSGKIDHIRFANEAILNLFCNRENIFLLELTKPIVRKKLSIPGKEFKEKLKNETENIVENNFMTKSDKLLDSFVLLYLVSSKL